MVVANAAPVSLQGDDEEDDDDDDDEEEEEDVVGRDDVDDCFEVKK